MSCATHPPFAFQASLTEARCIPNDIILGDYLAPGTPRFLLVTGPNMGGKSTVLRQVRKAGQSILPHRSTLADASGDTRHKATTTLADGPLVTSILSRQSPDSAAGAGLCDSPNGAVGLLGSC
jgi:hypothetical protein